MKKLFIFLIVLGLLAVGGVIFFTSTSTGQEIWNNWQTSIQESKEKSELERKKKVEDTCRSMIASYKKDVITYEGFKDNDDEFYRSIAMEARIRANQTASTYNEYILKNSYVWKDNAPSDIASELEYI